MRTDVRNDMRAPRTCEDRLLLDEFTHRTGNEIAAAIAALRIARRMHADASRERLLDEALGRMEAFGEVHRLLAERQHGQVDAGDRLRRLCFALASSRPHIAGAVSLDIPEVSLDAATARCLLMVGSEVVTNALRHAFTAGASKLLIRLVVHRGSAVMTIADDGPGMQAGGPSGGTGLGRGIVEDLIGMSGGSFGMRSGPGGTRIRVTLPLAPKMAKRSARL